MCSCPKYSGPKIAHLQIEIFYFISLITCSEGYEILVLSISFQKSNIGWPQQPPTERVSVISEKLDFWWSYPQKGTSMNHLGANNDPTIRISNFFWWNEAMEATELVEAVEVVEATEVLRPGKSLPRTPVIQGFEF